MGQSTAQQGEAVHSLKAYLSIGNRGILRRKTNEGLQHQVGCWIFRRIYKNPYWPPGNAFCIFYGPTPASSGDKPRAASPVNILGSVLGDATQFRAVKGGLSVRIEKG